MRVNLRKSDARKAARSKILEFEDKILDKNLDWRRQKSSRQQNCSDLSTAKSNYSDGTIYA
jgi:hypothetical protein